MCQRLISRLLSPLKIVAYCLLSDDSMDSSARACTPREWPLSVARRLPFEGSQTINVASAEAETSTSFPPNVILRTAFTKSVCPDNRFAAVLARELFPVFQQ